MGFSLHVEEEQEQPESYLHSLVRRPNWSSLHIHLEWLICEMYAAVWFSVQLLDGWKLQMV